MFDLNYPTVELDYKDWHSFNIDTIEKNHFAITIYRENIKYEFIIKINKMSDKVLIFGSGANPHSKSPIFNRISWIDDFDYNIIYYNDPTVYLDDIKIGWGYGNKDRHFITEIGEIIQEYINKINIKNKNVYFFGSSGGGFNSIMISTLVKGSTAIVYNPQTSIIRYSYKTVVDQLFKSVYDNYSDKDIENNKWRINAIDFMIKNNNTPKLFYIVNLGSKGDVENQLIPFIHEAEENGYGENITIISFYDKELDHNCFSKIETIKLINCIIEGKSFSDIKYKSI